MTIRPTRRQFLAASALAAGGLGLTRPASASVRVSRSANEAISLGFIGVGGMGQGLLNIFKGMPDVRVAVVCDVDESHRLQAKESAGGKPETTSEFREVIDRKDIDAVVVATPDHWHAIPTLLALAAEKDVYCEKPLAYRIGESRRMADAAKKYNRVTQMGNLIHASETWRRVVEIVQSGVLGKISKVRVWMAGNQGGLGNPPDAAPPPGLDYNTWLGPAPERPYNPSRSHFNWRYFWDYGGGYLTDFCCHIIDPVHWAMDVLYPESIAASGGRWVLDDNAETPDTLEVVYQYRQKNGDPFLLVWSQTDRNSRGPGGGGLGVSFHGTRGTLTADYNTYEILPEPDVEIVEPEPSLPRSPGHHREWLDAIKSRGTCPCNFAYGHRLSSVGHLGNMALWTGEKLAWDGQAERVTNHDRANAFLLRDEYRKPWALPEV